MNSAVLAEVTRSGRVESRHSGAAVLCDPSGKVKFGLGSIDEPTYFRSCAKPFQALTLLRDEVDRRFTWSLDELAIICASHSSEPGHVDVVRRILAKAELTEADLECGVHPPLGDGPRDELIRSGVKPTPSFNNCSGKHSGMLSWCRVKGESTRGYVQVGHPLQRENRGTLARALDVKPEAIEIGVDGCGAPTFYLSPARMATAFARLATGDRLDASDRPHAERIVSAMTARPWHVAGTGRFDTELMSFADGRVVCKLGAEGLLCLSLVREGLGLAIKVDDGAHRAGPAIALTILRKQIPDLDWSRFESSALRPLLNARKEAVGEIRCSFG